MNTSVDWATQKRVELQQALALGVSASALLTLIQADDAFLATRERAEIDAAFTHLREAADLIDARLLRVSLPACLRERMGR